MTGSARNRASEPTDFGTRPACFRQSARTLSGRVRSGRARVVEFSYNETDNQNATIA